MVTVKIEGHLLQSKLEEALAKIVGKRAWLGREFKVPGTRLRWDMAYEIDGGVVVVEFDGEAHYRDPLRIKKDLLKDEIAKQYNYTTIRIPYWVQLNNQTLKYYFGLKANIMQDFPHGFITTKHFPASFCELGVKRFKKEYEELPVRVRNAVRKSLIERSEENGKIYVLPRRLWNII